MRDVGRYLAQVFEQAADPLQHPVEDNRQAVELVVARRKRHAAADIPRHDRLGCRSDLFQAPVKIAAQHQRGDCPDHQDEEEGAAEQAEDHAVQLLDRLRVDPHHQIGAIRQAGRQDACVIIALDRIVKGHIGITGRRQRQIEIPDDAATGFIEQRIAEGDDAVLSPAMRYRLGKFVRALVMILSDQISARLRQGGVLLPTEGSIRGEIDEHAEDRDGERERSRMGQRNAIGGAAPPVRHRRPSDTPRRAASRSGHGQSPHSAWTASG
ncbi:hypothetical protein WR25_10277 [Diploscapter pachys]|uniref:Uncharacterized protein n=1 Tax=Diploscapter pachys TaxID=2018661 RepID=A0A2A2M3L8_9BILA|nr:hypothetical protein WR25_10277 [Diploscapter pachys]